MYNLTSPALAYKIKEFNRIFKSGKGGNSKKNRSKHSITFHTKSRNYQSIKCFLQSTFPAKPSAKFMMLHESSKKNTHLFHPPYQARCFSRFYKNQCNKEVVKNEPNFLSPLLKRSLRQCHDKGHSWDSWNRLDANKDLLTKNYKVKSLRELVSSFFNSKTPLNTSNIPRSFNKTTINIASSKSDNHIFRSRSRKIKRVLSCTTTIPCRNRHTKNTPDNKSETDEKNAETGVLNPIKVAFASIKTNISKQMMQLKSKYLKISEKKIDVKGGNYPFIKEEFLTGKIEKPKQKVTQQKIPKIEIKLDEGANKNESLITEESMKYTKESRRETTTKLCKLTTNSIKEEQEVRETHQQLKLTWKTKENVFKKLKKNADSVAPKTVKKLPKVKLEDLIIQWRKNSQAPDPCIKVKNRSNIDPLDFKNSSGKVIKNARTPEVTLDNIKHTKKQSNLDGNKSKVSIAASGGKDKKSKTAIQNKTISKLSKYKVRPITYKNPRLKERKSMKDVLKKYQIKPSLIDFENADKEFKFASLNGDSPKLNISEAGSKIRSIVPKVSSIADVCPKSCKREITVIKSDVCPKIRTNEDIVPKVLKSKISPKPCVHVNAAKKLIKSKVSPRTRTNEDIVPKVIKSKVSPKSCVHENIGKKLIKSEVSPKSLANKNDVSKVVKSEGNQKTLVSEKTVPKVIKSEVSLKTVVKENKSVQKSSPETLVSEKNVPKLVKSEVDLKSHIKKDNVPKLIKSETSVTNTEKKINDIPKATKDKASPIINKNETKYTEKFNLKTNSVEDLLKTNKSEDSPKTNKNIADKQIKDIQEKTKPNESVTKSIQHTAIKPKKDVLTATKPEVKLIKEKEKRVKDFVGSPITHKSLNTNDKKINLSEKNKFTFKATLTKQTSKLEKTEKNSDIKIKSFKDKLKPSTINYLNIDIESILNDQYRQILEGSNPKIKPIYSKSQEKNPPKPSLKDPKQELTTNKLNEEMKIKSKPILSPETSGVNQGKSSPITCKLDEKKKTETSIVDFRNLTYKNKSETSLVNYRNPQTAEKIVNPIKEVLDLEVTKSKSITNLTHHNDQKMKIPFREVINIDFNQDIPQQNLSRITLKTLDLDQNINLGPQLPYQPEVTKEVKMIYKNSTIDKPIKKIKPAKVIDKTVDLDKAKEENRVENNTPDIVANSTNAAESTTKFLKCKFFKYKNKGVEIDKKLVETAKISENNAIVEQKNVPPEIGLLKLVEETSNNVEKLLKKMKEVNPSKSEDDLNEKTKDLLQIKGVESGKLFKKEETIPFNRVSGELLMNQELILENLRNILVKIEEVKSEYLNADKQANIKGEKALSEQKTNIQSKLDVIEDSLKGFLTNLSDSSSYHIEGNFRIKKTSPDTRPSPPISEDKKKSSPATPDTPKNIPAKRPITGKEHWLTVTHEHLRKIVPDKKIKETKNLKIDAKGIGTKYPPGSLMYFYLLEADTGDVTEFPPANTKVPLQRNKIENKGAITTNNEHGAASKLIPNPSELSNTKNKKKKSRKTPNKPIYNEKKAMRQLPDLTPKGNNQSEAAGGSKMPAKKGLSRRKRRGFIYLRRFLKGMPRTRRGPNKVEGEPKLIKKTENSGQQIERVLRKYKLKEEVADFSGVSLPDLEMNRRRLEDTTKKTSFYKRLDEKLFSPIKPVKENEEGEDEAGPKSNSLKKKENNLFSNNNSTRIKPDYLDPKSKLLLNDTGINSFSTNRTKSLENIREETKYRSIPNDFLCNTSKSSGISSSKTTKIMENQSNLSSNKEINTEVIYNKILSDKSQHKEPISEAETLFQILYNNVIGNIDFEDTTKITPTQKLSGKAKIIQKSESTSSLKFKESIEEEFNEKYEDKTEFRWNLLADRRVLPIGKFMKNKESYSNGETPNKKRELLDSWKMSD